MRGTIPGTSLVGKTLERSSPEGEVLIMPGKIDGQQMSQLHATGVKLMKGSTIRKGKKDARVIPGEWRNRFRGSRCLSSDIRQSSSI